MIDTPDEPRFGYILLTDMLGTSSKSNEELLEISNTFSKLSLEATGRFEVFANSLQFDTVQLATELFEFGDSSLFIWDSAQIFNNPTAYTKEAIILLYIAYVGSFIIVHCLHKGILIRGTISRGEFYNIPVENPGKGRRILGSAINQAAAWYEQPQLCSIACTPSLCIHIDHLLEDPNLIDTASGGNLKLYKNLLSGFLPKYAVPLKSGMRNPLRITNWPVLMRANYQGTGSNDDCSRLVLLSKLAEKDIPVGTENKYLNTLELFDDEQLRDDVNSCIVFKELLKLKV